MKENLTRELFVKDSKDIIKLLNIILQNFKNEIIPLIDKYSAQNAITNINKLPEMITKTLSDINEYSQLASKEINNNKSKLESTNQSFVTAKSSKSDYTKNDNTPTNKMSSGKPTFNTGKGNVLSPAPPLPIKNNYSSSNNNLYNPYRQESLDLFLETENNSGGIISNTISAGVNSISNIFRVLTFKKNSLDNALDDATGNIHKLHKRLETTITANSWEGTKAFFKSPELWRSIGGLAAIVGIVYLFIKVLKKIKNWVTGKDSDY